MEKNKINDLKVTELKKMLQDRGLSTAGLKADLVERLKTAIESSEGDSSNGGHSVAEGNLPASLDSTAADAVNIPAKPDLTDAMSTAVVSSAALAENSNKFSADAAGVEEGNSTSEAPASVETNDDLGVGLEAGAADNESAGAEVGCKRSASEIEGGAEDDSSAKQLALATPADPNLPPPWTTHVSTRTGKPYWYNSETKLTTWTYPLKEPEPVVHSAPVVTSSGQLPTRPGAEKCKHYLRYGTCKYGEGCRFDHPPEEKGTEVEPPPRPSIPRPSISMSAFKGPCGLPVRPGEQECAYFMKTGQCKYGETCKWNHPADRQKISGGGGSITYGGGMSGLMGMPSMGMGMPSMGANEWEKHMSDLGRPYYYNSRTQESTWDPPPSVMMGIMAGMMGMGGMGGGMGGMCSQVGGMGGAISGAVGGLLGGSGNVRQVGLAGGLHPIRPGAEKCAFYLKTGSCKFGETCKFDHPPEMLGVGSAGAAGAVDSVQAVGLAGGQHPIRPGAEKCAFFLKTGICKFGETCKFDHPPEMLGVGAAGAVTRQSGFKPVEIRQERSVMIVEDSRQTAPTSVTAEGYPVRPGMPDCAFYVKSGMCKFATTCKFNHPHKGLSGLPDASGMSNWSYLSGFGM